MPNGTGHVGDPVEPCPEDKGTLLVMVQDEETKAGLTGFSVEAKGKGKKSADTDADGKADLGALEASTYTVTVKPDQETGKDYYVPEEPSKVEVADGQPKLHLVDATKKIVVTPKLDVEYLAVLKDRGLAKHQPKEEEDPATPTPVYVEIWMEQDKDGPSYDKGVKITAEPANVEFFEDRELKKKAKSSVQAKDVTGGKKVTLWMAGKKTGKFALKLEVLSSKKKEFKAAAPAELEMGVVELESQIFRWEPKGARKPALKAMKDKDKVASGRYLVKQTEDVDQARAKLVVTKVEADQWPDGCDDYEIVLDVADYGSGSLKIFDDEWGDSEQSTPLKIKKGDLNAEKVLWVEGAATADKLRANRLLLGLDRPAGGVANETKENGDCAFFTVLEFDKVAPTSEFENASAEYADDEFKVDVNLKKSARKIKVKAQLKEKMAGIPVYFMLAPDEDNGGAGNLGEDVPADMQGDGGTWKWSDVDKALKHKDKKGEKDYLHLTAKTNNDGIAETELQLSAIGRQVFRVGAYLLDDHHLAEYDASDAAKKARKPFFSQKITVRRKIWYQIAKADTCGAPAAAAAETAYDNVGVLLSAGQMADFAAGSLKTSVRNTTFYPKWMVDPKAGGNDSVAVVGGHNWAHFRGKESTFWPKTDDDEVKKLKACILVCDYQWDPEGWSALKEIVVASNPSKWIRMTNSKGVVKPALKGKLIKTAKWEAREIASGKKKKSGSLKDDAIIIDSTRNKKGKVKVQLPASANAYINDSVKYEVKVKLQLAVGGSYLGESKGKHILAVYDSSDEPDYNDTIAHEIGHSLSQTPAGTGGVPKGMPEHPFWNQGMGTHCSYPTPVTAADRSSPPAASCECIMFESVPGNATHTFCKICLHYLLGQDMSSFK